MCMSVLQKEEAEELHLGCSCRGGMQHADSDHHHDIGWRLLTLGLVRGRIEVRVGDRLRAMILQHDGLM